MWPRRIAVGIVLLVSAGCLSLAAVVFVNLRSIESPERYLALLIGLVMLYMGGSMLAAAFRPSKPKAADAPIEIPPLHQVRGRTSYRDDSAKWRNVVLFIGAIVLAVSLSAAREQPVVVAVVAVGIVAGAGVMTWRQIQFGRARLELEMPARRGDVMRGVITTSGFGWTVAHEDFDATVELSAMPGARSARAAAQEHATTSVTRDGKEMTFRFTAMVPAIDTSERRVTWNLQLETQSPEYRAAFVVDVA